MTIDIDEVVARIQRELDQLRARQDTAEADIEAQMEAIETQVVTRTRDMFLLAGCVEDYLKRRQTEGQALKAIGDAMLIREADEAAVTELVDRLGGEVGQERRRRRRDAEPASSP